MPCPSTQHTADVLRGLAASDPSLLSLASLHTGVEAIGDEHWGMCGRLRTYNLAGN